MNSSATRVGRYAGGTVMHILDDDGRSMCRRSGVDWARTAPLGEIQGVAPGVICVTCRDRELARRRADAAAQARAQTHAQRPVRRRQDWYAVVVSQTAVAAPPLVVCKLWADGLQGARDHAITVIEDAYAEDQGGYPGQAGGDASRQALLAAATAVAGIRISLPHGSLRLLTHRQALRARERGVPCPRCGNRMAPRSRQCRRCGSAPRVKAVLAMWRMRTQEDLTNKQIAARLGCTALTVACELGRLRSLGFNVPGSPGQGSGSTADRGKRDAHAAALAAGLAARGIRP